MAEIIRHYGALSGSILAMPGGGTGLSIRLRVNFVGQFSYLRLAEQLRALYEVAPPDAVILGVRRRNYTSSRGRKYALKNSYRPVLELRWFGENMRKMLDYVGWQVGKAKFDAQARALQRWYAYKEESAHA